MGFFFVHKSIHPKEWHHDYFYVTLIDKPLSSQHHYSIHLLDSRLNTLSHSKILEQRVSQKEHSTGQRRLEIMLKKMKKFGLLIQMLPLQKNQNLLLKKLKKNLQRNKQRVKI